MTWQRVARVALAVAGLGTAIAIVVLTRERPKTDRPSVATPADPNATLQAGRGTTLTFRDGKQVRQMEYEESVQNVDGKTVLKKVRLNVDDGTRFFADVVETSGKAINSDQPNELTATGNVRLETSEGATLEGTSGTFSEATGIATIPGAVAFSRGRMSGTGTDGVYDRTTGTFRIASDPHVTTKADDAGHGQIDATGKTFSFIRQGDKMLFEGDARIVQGADTLSGNRATLYLTGDQQQIRLIELRGASKVVPGAGSTSTLPDMHADDIDLAFYPDTQVFEQAVLNGRAAARFSSKTGMRSIEGTRITFTTAPDGKTLTRLESTERVVVTTPSSETTPARVIRAATLLATGNGREGLTAAIFSGGVTFTEATPAAPGRPAGTRTGSSQRLTLKIHGEFDAIEEAQFLGEFAFTGGDVKASADLGTYRAAKGELELRPSSASSRRLPHTQDSSVSVDARDLITIDLNTNNLDAWTDVKSVSQGAQKQSASKRASAIFNTQESLLGFGNEFHYESRGGRAQYLGSVATPAKLQQGETVVLGREIVASNDGQDLTATGSVDSTFSLADDTAGPAKAPTRYHIVADALSYTDATRAATYTGKPAVLDGPDSKTQGDTVVLTLEPDSQQLRSLLVTKNMQATLPNDRQASGDSLLYEASKGQYTLKGLPLRLRVREADGTCSETTGASAHFDRTTSAPEWLGAENPGGVVSGQSCTGPVTK